jgi:hypothetical protein
VATRTRGPQRGQFPFAEPELKEGGEIPASRVQKVAACVAHAISGVAMLVSMPISLWHVVYSSSP